MKKIKIIAVCLFILSLVLITISFLKINDKETSKQKTLLAQDTRKVLSSLMFDLSQARENTILDVPADGMWHNRVAFGTQKQGVLEYFIKEKHLFRANHGKTILIADHISKIFLRRQIKVPGILEVRIEARSDVSLVSNLRIRMIE